MLEIIALVFLCKKIGALAEQKGLKPGTWKLYTVLAWFGMEFLGIMIAMSVFGANNLVMYILVAIPCAIGGYHIVRTILSKKPDMMDDINSVANHLE